MIRVPVTQRMRPEGDASPYETVGFAPSADCPLAVTNTAHFDFESEAWKVQEQHWNITHRPTGYKLGELMWETRDEAFEVLMRCDLDFAAWPLAKGDPTDPATIACNVKFRMAVESK